ncbi:MFS transporter [Candidatus Poribacteria bacterium]|nr:MFS transporter [Candidatus Poribacteria bacterium]MYA58300.1 MFS transporter [Candidatus Poribacteria bacterium]
MEDCQDNGRSSSDLIVKRMWSRGFIFLCAIVFVVGLVTGPVQMLFPVYAETILKETALFAALLRALPIGLGGISALIGGTLSDRFGRKPAILIGMTGAVVVGGLFTTETPLFIWGILCYEGIASGFKTAGGQTYLISVVPSNRLGVATGLYFINMTVGSAVGSAIAGEVIDRIDYGVFGIGAVVLAGVLFIGACFFLPRLARQPSSNSQRKQGGIWKSTLNIGAYIDLSRRRNMKLLIGLRVFPTYYWGSVNLLMPILIARIAGVKATGYYGAVSLLFAFGCQLAVGRICDAIGHRTPALMANALVTLLAFGVAFFHDSLIALEVFGILGAGAAWGLSTTIPRFINEFTEAHEKGHGVGLTHLAWSTGFLLGYVASGFLINFSVHVPFIVAGIFLIFSTAIAYKLFNDSN